MKFCIQCCCYAVLFGCGLVVEAKIVYLNGTEVIDDNPKTDNATTVAPAQKWFSVFNPRNISNHSGTKIKIDKVTLNRKNDAEEQEGTTQEENDSFPNGTIATRESFHILLEYILFSLLLSFFVFYLRLFLLIFFCRFSFSCYYCYKACRINTQ